MVAVHRTKEKRVPNWRDLWDDAKNGHLVLSGEAGGLSQEGEMWARVAKDR